MEAKCDYILLVTANAHERDALLNTEISGFRVEKSGVSDAETDNSIYNIGKLCDFNVVHLHLLQQGSSGVDASQSAITRAINSYNIKAVILVGICFGIKQSELNYNDVIVSSNIIDYENAALKGSKYEWRGTKTRGGRFLLSALSFACKDWSFKISNKKVKSVVGDILSGDKLMRSSKCKEKLHAKFPQAIGGEMEGRGAVAACQESDISEIVIIKSISDWGDENKNDAYQASAATSAVSFLKYSLSQPQARELLMKKLKNVCADTSFNLSSENAKALDDIFRSINSEFLTDIDSKMVQANEVDPEKTTPQLAKVFINLRARLEENGNPFYVFPEVVQSGNNNWDASRKESAITVKGSSRLSKKGTFLTNKLLVKGMAGQGKSTLCQFITQYFRAKFIEYFIKSGSTKIKRLPEHVKPFLDLVSKILKGIETNTIHRIPLNIKLKEYAAWMIKRKDNEPIDILSYLAAKIAEFSSSTFDTIMLRNLFNCENLKWFIVFDGLDEVPTSANRTEVMSNIQNFMESETLFDGTDIVYLATTRPDSYNDDFHKLGFTSSNLENLKIEDGIDYVKRYYEAIPMADEQSRKKCLEIYKNIAKDQRYLNLISNPLNVTILALLIRSEGELPRNQYSLYEEYFNTIFKREKNKANSDILKEYEREIKIIYSEFGFRLQEASSKLENASTTISEEDLNYIIHNAIIRRFEKQDDDISEIVEEIKKVLVNRLAFVFQNSNGFFFRIRSIQEFLAAKHIEDTFELESKLKLVEQMAQNPYWHNTLKLLMECLHEKNSPIVPRIINDTLRSLNGEDKDYEQKTIQQLIFIGSQTAYNWLSANIFYDDKVNENILVNYIEKLFVLQVNKQHIRQLSTFSDHARHQLSNKICEKLRQGMRSKTLLCFAVVLGYKYGYSNIIRQLDELKLPDRHLFEIYQSVCEPDSSSNIIELLYRIIKNNECPNLSMKLILELIKNQSGFDKNFYNQMLRICIKSFCYTHGAVEENENYDSLKKFFGFDIVAILQSAFGTKERLRMICKPVLNIFQDLAFDYPPKHQDDYERFRQAVHEIGLDILVVLLTCIEKRDEIACLAFYTEYHKSKEIINEYHLQNLIARNTLLYELENFAQNSYEIYANAVSSYFSTKNTPKTFIEYFASTNDRIISPFYLSLMYKGAENVIFPYCYEEAQKYLETGLSVRAIDSLEFICFVEYISLLRENKPNKKLLIKFQQYGEALFELGNKILKELPLWHIRLGLLLCYRNKQFQFSVSNAPLTKGVFELSGYSKIFRDDFLEEQNIAVLRTCLKSLVQLPIITERNFELMRLLLLEGTNYSYIIKEKYNFDTSIKKDRLYLFECLLSRKKIDYSKLSEEDKKILLNIITPIPKKNKKYFLNLLIETLEWCRNHQKDEMALSCEQSLFACLV